MNRPVALVCYICGREFGTKSLAIHIKSCQKKWQNQQNLKPPKERRPCPQPPKGLNEMLEKGEINRKDIEQMNSGAFNTFVEEALVECEFCHRRFNPTSLKPHQKACKGSPMIRKPYVSNAAKSGAVNPIEQQAIKPPSKGYAYEGASSEPQPNMNLQECFKCGRKFASDRVAKHEKVCKGEGIKVAKPEPVVATKPSKAVPKGPGKDPKWKVQHEEFQNAIKYMRKMKAIQEKGGKITDLPPPPKGNYDHYVECQYCGRKYAPDVAERHIPKCQNIINKPGGIKPSQIQQKYVTGTGAQANKTNPYQAPVPTTTTSNLRNSSGYKPSNPPAQQSSAYKPQTPSKVSGPTNSSKIQTPMMKPSYEPPRISQIDPRQSNGFSSNVKPQSPFKTAGKMLTSNQQYGQIFKR